jgi:hypothetical protein
MQALYYSCDSDVPSNGTKEEWTRRLCHFSKCNLMKVVRTVRIQHLQKQQYDVINSSAQDFGILFELICCE